MKWTVRRADVPCRGCGTPIAAGEPVALLTAMELERCASCAGQDVNHAEVDAARQRIKAEDAARLNAPKPVTYATRRPEDGFQSLRDVATSAPMPFSQLSAKDRRRHNAIAGNK